ncbi:MAG: DUF2071 domain-containing protein [Candidatus Sumerlaeia bacterium]|nr:DUF2071 domain-containing protein [Candidatus Sumerlaeia bacterium]
MDFLTARWEHLVLANYAMLPAVLAPYLPRGAELDLRGGEAFASLVAFHFLDTRVLGVPWPGFRDFTEVNLRFYVRAAGDRGVVFVSELVPQAFVAAMARLTYNEPYRAVPMGARLERAGGAVRVAHWLRFPFGTQHIEVEAEDAPFVPDADSEAQWFKEHQWGFGTDHFGRAIRYEVRHPRWRVLPVRSQRIEFDFGKVYGEPFAFMSTTAPRSVFLAEGSAVAVRVAGGI